MLTSIEKALKLSEIREKLNELNAVTDPTDAQQTEERDLTRESENNGNGISREALTTEGDRTRNRARWTPRTREYGCAPGLTRDVSGAIFARVCRASQQPTGAESELQAASRTWQPNQVPIDLLRVCPSKHRAITTGADARGRQSSNAVHACRSSRTGDAAFI